MKETVPADPKPLNFTLVSAVAETPISAVFAFIEAAISSPVAAAATLTVDEPIYPLIVNVSVIVVLAASVF